MGKLANYYGIKGNLMLFNSSQFIEFFVIFYILYLFVRQRLHLRNILLLIASYIFYASWNWMFLSLIMISTFVDYNIGRKLGKTPDDTKSQQRKRKILLLQSLAVNLGILGIFKYFNFFADSFADLLHLFGITADPLTLNVILPLGISFYTFQTISYTFDIYRKQLKPVESFIDFATFVAFFPQLVAGPIERASRLLPQIQSVLPIRLDQVYTGLYLILMGYFKKVVIADNAAIVANEIFNNYSTYQGLDIVLGVLAFAFQIYGDFSGYTDIARGIAKLMGFELMLNFRLPYFAVSPSDFWNRWHISLSTWLRDYLYIPLGGNRKGTYKTYRNLMITMLLGGLWHGAAWNFVLWGAFHGAILVLYRMIGDFTHKYGYSTPDKLFTPFKIILMFSLTLIGWLFFRAESIEQISGMITNALQFGTLKTPIPFIMENLGWHIIILMILELWQYRSKNLLIVTRTHWLFQSILYTFLVLWITIFAVRESVEFIYFQF